MAHTLEKDGIGFTLELVTELVWHLNKCSSESHRVRFCPCKFIPYETIYKIFNMTLK